MENNSPQLYTAFEGPTLLAQGRLDEVVLRVKKKLKSDTSSPILIFSDSTGKEMDFDLRGTEKEILQRLQIYMSPEEAPVSTGPGRPKLGVINREVSLLPRHWEWLATQTGGASATLRRLVDEARRSASGNEQIKQAQERTYKFMLAIAGNLPNFDEALRALYAKDKKKMKEQIAEWPIDIRNHTLKMSALIFEGER